MTGPIALLQEFVDKSEEANLMGAAMESGDVDRILIQLKEKGVQTLQEYMDSMKAWSNDFLTRVKEEIERSGR